MRNVVLLCLSLLVTPAAMAKCTGFLEDVSRYDLELLQITKKSERVVVLSYANGDQKLAASKEGQSIIAYLRQCYDVDYQLVLSKYSYTIKIALLS